MNYVLDASALIALALKERGAGIVATFAHQSLISTVNASEFLQRMADAGIADDEAANKMTEFEVTLVPFTADHARQAAAFRLATKKLGLSLGDRACLALAHDRRFPILTSDRRMAEADVGLDIRMIR
jgi:PIN domain nuclease of toxin-antitoxin system